MRSNLDECDEFYNKEQAKGLKKEVAQLPYGVWDLPNYNVRLYKSNKDVFVMNNRDFFTKPNQANGRSAEDYGHIYTSNNNLGTTGGFWGFIVGAVVFAIGMYAFIAV